MKWFIYSLLFLLSSNSVASDWASGDTNREILFQTLWAVDWAQTRTIVKSPEFYETNPYLGKYPSRKKVDRYFLTGALLHYGVSRTLSPKYRKAFQYFSIGYEANTIYRNYRLGINVSF